MLFSDIPGLDNEKKHLIKSAQSQRISHAQLFHSKPGSSALPLALAYLQLLACKNPKPNDSCGQCAHCKQFKSFNYPDLHFVLPVAKAKGSSDKPTTEDFIPAWRELLSERKHFSINDWLSHINVENKQALISVHESARIVKKLQLKAYTGHWKFMLIWLPEYMNASAANKLLKALEEPEDSTLFILVSENPERIIQTITSRCQKLFIPQHKPAEIKAWLIQHGVDGDNADTCSHLASGDMVEALKLAKDGERYHQYADVFKNWVRACFRAKVDDIFEFAESMQKMEREQQKEALRFFMQTIQISFSDHIKQNSIDHPLFKKVGFDLNDFAPYIHAKNARDIYQLLNEAYFDVSRNGNPRIIFSDCSFKLSRYLRVKNT